MDSTTKIEENEGTGRRRRLDLSHFLEGEFLRDKRFLPWLFYGLFVLSIVAVMVISEQQYSNKKKKVARLESTYRQEISRLKANNQFIPYEENQILIQKMMDRGFVLNVRDNYTIHVRKPVDDGKWRWFKRKQKHEGESKK